MKQVAKPTLAVVIPLFNKGPHIEKTLQSVLEQSRRPDEIVVVDDGSTDDGPLRVSTYASQGVRLLTQKNRGVSAARNTGIHAISADYVAFLDADDLWYPNHLQILQELIFDYHDVGLLSTMHEICLDGVRYIPKSPYRKGQRVRINNIFDAIADGLSIVNSSTACVKRKALLDIGGFPEGVNRGEDIITWCELARHSGAAHASEITVLYNRDAVNRAERRMHGDIPQSLKYLAKLIEENDLQDIPADSVAVLMDRIAFYTAAGMRVVGDHAGIRKIRKFAFINNRMRLWFSLIGVQCMPVILLSYLRRIRHKQAYT